MQESVLDIVRKMQQEDREGDTHISKYVSFSMREIIEKIGAYLNSKHTSGEKDSMGREKPFFNIVTASSNIWYRATDIDRKNIKLKATKQEHYALAFIVTILLNEWMRKESFGVYLNEWGRVLARYGSAISKFVEKDGKLSVEAMSWDVMIVDPVDFENNVKIEKLWYTPAQLREKIEYDQDMVESLILALEKRETADGQKKDNKSNFIEVFEVHGLLPLSLITEEDDDDIDYVQQMHVVSYTSKKEGRTGEYDDFTLYSGKEKKDPYQITHLIKEDGRTLSIGAVEHLFEAQWMMNHNVKAVKDQLDLASKLIFQTSDGNFVGQNILTDIENGDILNHTVNQPLTQINNNSHDVTSLQNFGNQWKQQANELANVSGAMLGETPKAGTAWRQTQAVLQESHSLFELMTENKGLAVEEIMREFIIPHLKSKMDTSDEISAILEEYQINKLDSMYVPNEASKRVNNMIIDDILSKTPEDIEKGNMFTPEQQEEVVANEEEAIQKALNTFGNQRFIKPSDVKDKTWKEVLKDFEWDVEVDVTGENKDVNAVVTTLTTVLQTIAGLQGQPMSPEMKIVFNKILNEVGALSPLELSVGESKPVPQAQPQPQPQPAPQAPMQQA